MTKHLLHGRPMPKLSIVRKWYFRWIEDYERTGIEAFATQAVGTLLLAYLIYDEGQK